MEFGTGTKRNYLKQLLTEAFTHVLTADFKNKTKKQPKKKPNRRKEKKPSTMKMLSLINSLIKK